MSRTKLYDYKKKAEAPPLTLMSLPLKQINNKKYKQIEWIYTN